MKAYKLLSWSAILLSVILLLLPRLIPICTGLAADNSPMRCHYAYQAEFIVALLAFILAGSLLVLRRAEARILSGFLILLVSIIVIILPQPWAIGICLHGGACAKTTFFITIAGSLLGLVGAAIVWLTWTNRQSTSQEKQQQIVNLQK
ncbi:DUF4418 family protein [Sporomusa acidovorans]|uniref:DUF4418 domain-containing protein n=1 Tax=Sporomusa acidovorans (strain ATCC 49682 / DSM 3132 / Mol) TaxID=1123286 RepID=A0ABZ3IYI0_SPOA4|nr:DUF4418 family protein [Sporomusa acidovorans]OZC16872.1 hypothetical protein SPACI_40920 [Sporomusa acidovorans DSM 3132]SDF24821.1 protein of unknown function [Sporomusa acidovorans]